MLLILVLSITVTFDNLLTSHCTKGVSVTVSNKSARRVLSPIWRLQSRALLKKNSALAQSKMLRLNKTQSNWWWRQWCCWCVWFSADTRLKEHREAMAVVGYQGDVLWLPAAIFRSTCSVDILYFPFDIQICNLKFGSWTYDGWKLDIDFHSDVGAVVRICFLSADK